MTEVEHEERKTELTTPRATHRRVSASELAMAMLTALREFYGDDDEMAHALTIACLITGGRDEFDEIEDDDMAKRIIVHMGHLACALFDLPKISPEAKAVAQQIRDLASPEAKAETDETSYRAMTYSELVAKGDGLVDELSRLTVRVLSEHTEKRHDFARDIGLDHLIRFELTV